MATDRYSGCEILGHEELGIVITAERRGEMAIVHTDKGVTYICSCREPHPQVDRPFSMDALDEEMGMSIPCDTEPA